ncbi:calcium homeostasis modulator protein 6 [Nematostella vectensis]|uniref:calcium homeostasis modulator protein 6 n=1 Tax=Nematostella vectensis TaxID=45351 RepID=UPI0020779B9C|nr:calcium homeostasis modulator protein 6 [Nematostella vectensis]
MSVLFGNFVTAAQSYAEKAGFHIKGGLISLIVYCGNTFMQRIVFSCPATNYALYGNLFLYAPAVVLFCLSLLVSESFWHLTTSCCHKKSKQRVFIFGESQKYIFFAMLPPIMWLLLSFADARYYICANVGPATEQQSMAASAESQVIAWTLLLVCTTIITLVFTIHRFFAKINSKILGRKDFEKLEAAEAVRLFNERIKPLAEQEAKVVVDGLF